MELNVYDLVRIRLHNVPTVLENFLNAEYYQLMDRGGSSSTQVDVEVSFRDSDHGAASFTAVKAPVGFDAQGAFLFDKNSRICRIHLEDFSKTVTQVECDSDFNLHFIAIIIEYLISSKLLLKGAVFCHASAFEMDGKLIMLPAWRHVGKTSTLLTFLRAGAQYISDDWVLFFSDGQIASLPKRLNLLYHNLSSFPFLLGHVPAPIDAYVRFVQYANDGYIDLNEEMIRFLQEQIRIRLDVEGVFGQKGKVGKKPLDSVFYLFRSLDPTRTVPEVEVREAPVEELATRITEAVAFEQSHFHALYAAQKSISGITDPVLEKRYERIESIYLEGLKKIQNLYLATVHQHLDPEHLKSRILDKIRKN